MPDLWLVIPYDLNVLHDGREARPLAQSEHLVADVASSVRREAGDHGGEASQSRSAAASILMRHGFFVLSSVIRRPPIGGGRRRAFAGVRHAPVYFRSSFVAAAVKGFVRGTK